jgi:hypothetical protein
MAETIKFALIGKQDLKLGTSTFEVVTADGRTVTMDEIDIGKLLESAPIKTYATTALLPTTNVAAGSLARVSADGFIYVYSGSAWAVVGGTGTHNHAASEITTGQLAVARGGTALDTSAYVQGSILYFNATGVLAQLTPGATGTFLKTQGASANPVWEAPGISAHTIDSHSDFPAITEAQGEILYHNGTNWVPLAVGTSGKFLQTAGAAANPVWASSSTILDKVTTDVTVTATTTETTIYSKSIAGATLSTSNALRLTIQISDLDLATADTVTFRFKYGGSTIATIALVPGACESVTSATLVLECFLQANATTSAQVGHIKQQSDKTSAPDISESFASGTSAIDSTVAQTLLVSSDFSSASAGDSITLTTAILESLT